MFSSGSYEDVVGGAYPLPASSTSTSTARRQDPDPLVSEFLKLVLSREGQEVVVKDGLTRP